MEKAPQFRVTHSLLVGIAFASILLPSHARAALIFQADFNGSGTGTGGVGNIVSLGGTGAWLAEGNTNTVGTPPLAPGGGNYLNVNSPSGSGAYQNYVSLTPTSAANSFASMAGTLTVGPNTYTTLNGGFDLFVKANSMSGNNTQWFRPIDLAGPGLSLIYNGTDNGALVLELNSTGGTGISNFTVAPGGGWGDSNAGKALIATNDFTLSSQAGNLLHLGFTFETDANGLITMKQFLAAGDNAIDTSSNANLLVSATLNIDATVGANPLSSGTFKMAQANFSGSFPVDANIDYDQLRIYNTDPGTFSALAVPEPSTFVMWGLGLLMMAGTRRRGRFVFARN